MNKTYSINLFKPKIYEESIEAVTEVLRSGWTGLGPKTKKFENDFSKYVNSKYAVGMNSATSALHLAMKLINLKEGDEIITSPITFVSTNHAILYEKGVPVFADVQKDTINIDPEDIKRKITKKTKAIICVHFGGYPCDMDEIHKIARDYDLYVIEDCAHATGSSYKGQKIGSISSINCFSFHSVKNLSICDGGAITTNSELYNDRLKKLRWLGINKSTHDRTKEDGKEKSIIYSWKYDVDEIGYKYHMNDIMASIGIEQLKYVEKDNDRRREIASIYNEGLRNIDGIELLNYKDDRITSRHLYVMKVDRRDKLIMHLKNNGIAPGVHYLRNDYYNMYDKTHLSNVDEIQDKIISLPLHLHLTNEEVEYVINTIKKF